MREGIYIGLEAMFGDDLKVIEISQPLGAGDGYSVHINRRYQGILVYRHNEWQCYINPASVLNNVDDVTILIELIIEADSTLPPDISRFPAFIKW